MDYLIKYRNERKNEGASKAELNGLDGRINAGFSSGVVPMDLELLKYREAVAASGNKEFLARLDTHIFHQLGSKPSRIIDVAVNTPANSASGVYVAVDVANETIGDLSSKAHTALGSKKQGKLIFMGTCYEDPKKPLSETPLSAGAMVVIVGGNRREDIEFAQSYARLCDADQRSAKKLFDKVPADKLHELFVVMSKMKVEPVTQERDLWASRCEAVPVASFLRCVAIDATAQNDSVTKICALISEKPAPFNSDEDLYA